MSYSLTPRRIWKRQPGFTGCPEQVSVHGALPQPIQAYKMEEHGFSIYDSRNNTYSNSFFGKIGIKTLKEGEEIIKKLQSK